MLPPASSGEQSLAYSGNGGKEALGPFYPNKPPQDKQDVPQQGPKTRKEWLKEWETNNCGRVLPCSAKAVYRLADSELTNGSIPCEDLYSTSPLELDLTELKIRAFQVSLTANAPR